MGSIDAVASVTAADSLHAFSSNIYVLAATFNIKSWQLNCDVFWENEFL